MTLNIKNPRVVALAEEVAAMTGESKTEAIGRALEERADRLRAERRDRTAPAARLRRFLEREVWPSLPADVIGRPMSKAEREALLGYGEHGA